MDQIKLIENRPEWPVYVTSVMNFGFHEMWVIYWLSKQKLYFFFCKNSAPWS
jgi:hypothetical protein